MCSTAASKNKAEQSTLHESSNLPTHTASFLLRLNSSVG